MPLGAVLRREFDFSLQVIRAHDTSLLHRNPERLFTEYVHIPIEGPVGNERVVMVRRADNYRFNVFLIQQASPVPISLRFRKYLERFLCAEIVYVAQRDHILIAQNVVMRRSPAPNSDESYIELVARSILSAERPAFQNRQ